MNARATFALIAVAVLLSIGLILMTDRATTTPTWDDAVGEAQRGGYRLLTTDDLKKLYEDRTPDLLLVDTRQDWEHRTGHIEGSVNFSMEPTAWARWTKRGDIERLLGPDKDRPVVFY
ncbi:MAG: rhodanese-like domain-containing protein [Desulfomicrobium sp.]|nr:rhodanese-like domain-containing protein [Pseudomonadota bacterium]MBV1713826.1 rhodanese-like domain-containing protein [Desulfomicrobium sp.]MBU4572361.1 rhodanese-like domain-containing protein [Pseudomonadota bacterium]MBU4594341.1 rhodanese-like domain-containing protein [Pseudomonadota bacterium]MBV1719508.1 rhodanese-like domain-containing protein [Desulfomicrobium sp.]